MFLETFKIGMSDLIVQPWFKMDVSESSESYLKMICTDYHGVDFQILIHAKNGAGLHDVYFVNLKTVEYFDVQNVSFSNMSTFIIRVLTDKDNIHFKPFWKIPS